MCFNFILISFHLKLNLCRITIRLAQSSRKVMLQVNGEGREPCLELHTNLLEFGPILPHAQGDERTVVLRNPGVFPIEVYNVEFDTQFMDEERVCTYYVNPA